MVSDIVFVVAFLLVHSIQNHTTRIGFFIFFSFFHFFEENVSLCATKLLTLKMADGNFLSNLVTFELSKQIFSSALCQGF